MKILTQIERMKYIDWLIRRKATETPKQLAEKLNVSVITIYRYIRELKDMGAPIVYCRYCESYKYTNEDYKLEFKIF